MCLYPKLISNPKYKPNKKNGYNPPEVWDERLKLVPIGCQKCIECRKQKARNWNVRLSEEIRTNKEGTFVTLTFSDENFLKLSKEFKGIEGYDLDNEIATLAVRRFLERWRKKTKKSIKHWLITELGHNGTENIHLHGIIFSQDKKLINETWSYGWVFLGDYVNEKTINYITKYVTKTDLLHKEYNPKILTSPGIGSNYLKRPDSKMNSYICKENQTNELYINRQGFKIALPIYYRNKIYSEDEREFLWIEKLNKQERYVMGKRIDISQNFDEYYRSLNQARNKNRRLNYGDDTKDWKKIEYEKQMRKLKQEQRFKKLRNKD